MYYTSYGAELLMLQYCGILENFTKRNCLVKSATFRKKLISVL